MASHFDTNRVTRLVHGVDAKGVPSEFFYGRWRQGHISTALDVQGHPPQRFYDSTAAPRIHTSITQDKAAAFLIMGTNRAVQHAAIVAAGGVVEHALPDGKGQIRARTSLDKDGKARNLAR
jgi:hypothetical protein